MDRRAIECIQTEPIGVGGQFDGADEIRRRGIDLGQHGLESQRIVVAPDVDRDGVGDVVVGVEITVHDGDGDDGLGLDGRPSESDDPGRAARRRARRCGETVLLGTDRHRVSSDSDPPCPGGGRLDRHLFHVVEAILATSSRRSTGIRRIDGPREPPVPGRIRHHQVEIVHQCARGQRRRRCVVPGQGDSKFRVARFDDHEILGHLAVRDLVLDDGVRTKCVDRLTSADRSESILAVGTGISKVVARVGEQCLQGTVSDVLAIRIALSPVLNDQGGDAGRGRRRHRGAAVARVSTTGHGARDAVVTVALTAWRRDVGLDSAVVGRSPAGEGGDRIVVRVRRADRDVVLRTGRRGRGVEELAASIRLAFVAVGPDDSNRRAQTTADHRVDQVARDAVVTGPLAGESVRSGVGPDRVVRDDRTMIQDRVAVVRFEIPRIGVEESF